MSLPPPSGEGFPKSQRLRTRPEFLRVQRNGRRIHLRFLIASWLPTRSSRARFGLTVSRKVGNAVVRNRVKRALRECLRRVPDGGLRPLDALPGVDVVFIARSTAGGAPAPQLEADVTRAVQQICAAQAA